MVPQRFGGLGLGTEPQGADRICTLLRLLGRANLALGCLIEAHMTALRLIFRFGDETVKQAAARDATDGHLVGLWVTWSPGIGLFRYDDDTVSGSRQFCCGAGHVSRAVVTAMNGAGATRLVYTRLEVGTTANALPGGLAGIRAATTGQVTFDHAVGCAFGDPPDHALEPEHSCGAWRRFAVILGGIDGLTEQLRCQLASRSGGYDPQQQCRLNQALVLAKTLRLWVVEAGIRAEAADADPAPAIAYMSLARVAVEQCCLDVIELAQRALGLAAFLKSNPVERICRDLATAMAQMSGNGVSTA